MQLFYLALTLVLINGEHHVIIGNQFATLRDCNIAIVMVIRDMKPREPIRSWQLDCMTRAELQQVLTHG